METLQAADVAALKCRFVNEIYKHITCLTYSVNCCSDSATQAWLDYKRASSTCPLTNDEYCYLKDKAKTSLVMDCATTFPCESQAQINVKVSQTGNQYTTWLIAPTYSPSAEPTTEGKAYVSLTNDSIIQKADVVVGLYDQNFTLLQNAVIQSGTAKVNGVEVSSPIYDLKVSTYFGIDAVSNLQFSYIRKIRIYYTDSLGAYVANQFWDIDVSPVTSPYLNGPGMTTVDPDDLFFTSPNWANALQTVMQNAMFFLLGHPTNYIDFYASKASNIDRLTLTTRIKHNPITFWCGLNHLDFKVEYFNGLKGLVGTLTQSSFPTPVRAEGGNIYGQHTFSVECGNATIELDNSQLTLPINVPSTRFNRIGLSSQQPSQNVVVGTNGSIDCTSTVLTATVNTIHSVTLIQWLNPVLTIIGTGFTYIHNGSLPPGTYTCRITLSSGCEVDQTFEIT